MLQSVILKVNTDLISSMLSMVLFIHKNVALIIPNQFSPICSFSFSPSPSFVVAIDNFGWKLIFNFYLTWAFNNVTLFILKIVLIFHFLFWLLCLCLIVITKPSFLKFYHFLILDPFDLVLLIYYNNTNSSLWKWIHRNEWQKKMIGPRIILTYHFHDAKIRIRSGITC